MSGAMSVHSEASDAPSKVTEPIITATSAAVPGSGSNAARPESGTRSPISSPRRSTGDRREKRLKYTENASPRSIHASTPYSAIATKVSAE
jgi:hypothetical protein